MVQLGNPPFKFVLEILKELPIRFSLLSKHLLSLMILGVQMNLVSISFNLSAIGYI